MSFKGENEHDGEFFDVEAIFPELTNRVSLYNSIPLCSYPELVSVLFIRYIFSYLPKQVESPALIFNSVQDYIHILFRLSKNVVLARL